MTGEGFLAEQFKQFIKDSVASSFIGKVAENANAENNAMIYVVYNDFTYKVKLKSIKDEKDKHLLIIPVKDSYVFCVNESYDGERYVVVACNEIEKIIFQSENISLNIDDTKKKLSCIIGNSSVVIDDKSIVFNEASSNSFLININNITKQLNAIENDLNNVKTIFKSWVPVPQDGGAALKSSITSWASKSITNTNVDDIKDDKIKH